MKKTTLLGALAASLEFPLDGQELEGSIRRYAEADKTDRFTAWIVMAIAYTLTAGTPLSRPLCQPRFLTNRASVALPFSISRGLAGRDVGPELQVFYKTVECQDPMDWMRRLRDKVNQATQSRTQHSPSWNEVGEIAGCLYMLDLSEQTGLDDLVARYIDWLIAQKAEIAMIALVLGQCFEETFASVPATQVATWATFCDQQWYRALVFMIAPKAAAEILATTYGTHQGPLGHLIRAWREAEGANQ